jgi:hypothetical protein
MTRFRTEKAELYRSKFFNVAEAIENGKSFPVFQNARAVIGQRGRRTDVIFIFDGDNIFQQRFYPSNLWYLRRDPLYNCGRTAHAPQRRL